MADDPRGQGSEGLEEDALVTELVRDPARPPKLAALTGWVGRSTREGRVRLYLTPEFDAYVEFAVSDIVHHRSLATDASPLGGTVVWLQGDAKVDMALGRDARAEFLTGEITVNYMPEAVAGGPLLFKTVPVTTITRGGCGLGWTLWRGPIGPVTRAGCGTWMMCG